MTVRVAFDARSRAMYGIDRVARELLTALQAEPAGDVEVVGVRGPGPEPLRGAAGASAGPRHVVLRSRPFLPLEQVTMPRLARRVAADVWHSPHFNVPYLLRAPLVLTVHDLFPLLEPRVASSRLRRRYYATLLPEAIRRADAVVCVSRYTADSVRARFDIDEGRLHIVPLGLDHAHFRRPSAAGLLEARARLGLPASFLLYVGSAKHQKNLPLLCAAWRDRLPPLVIVGSSPRDTAHLALPARTVVLGAVREADLPFAYAAARAVVVPSLYEAVGLPVLEAMAVGTPVVCSTGGGLPDTAGGAALLVDPGDDAGWTDALTRICSDGELRDRLVRDGASVAAQRDWRVTARGYLEVYAGVAC